MSIYFAQIGDSGPVKIGFSKRPKLRLVHLNTASPEKVFLRAVLDGDQGKEKELHESFAKHRLNGEWFEPAPRLLKLIAANKPEETDPQPEPKLLGRDERAKCMNQTDIISDMEARASKLGVKMYLVCQDAGVAPTTYYRWREGSSANLATLNKLDAALSAREKQAA